MSFRIAVLLVALSVIVPQQLRAQAIYEAFGFPKTVTATGHTELLGSVHVAQTLHTSAADTLIIDVAPLRVTNASAADIRITPAGNITFGAVTIEAAEGRVRIPVNAGATSGSFRVEGIRVSIGGTNATSVTARLRWANGRNILNTTSVVVANQVLSGLAVDPMTDRFSIFNSIVADATATIVLREGYNEAFLNSAEFGQANPTRIRIRVSDFPSGLRMIFPAAVTSAESAATLTTVEGTAVTLPRSDGNTEVTYEFAAAGNSETLVESFSVPFTVATVGPVATIQPTIEVSLAPIGAAVPTEALSSTGVPRFAEENLVVLEGSSRIITKTYYWTGVDNAKENRLSLFNPSASSTNLTLSAFGATGQLISGQNITNPVQMSLSGNQTSNRTLADIFGTGATSISTLRVQSTRSELLATNTVTSGGISESAPLVDRLIFSFVSPLFNEATSLNLFNPQSVKVSGTLTYRTSGSTVVSTKQLELEPMSTTVETIPVTTLYGNQPGIGFQIQGNFDRQIIVQEAFGTSSTLNYLLPEPAAGQPRIFVPFFATGGGYETDLSLINPTDEQVTLTAQLLDNSGASLAPARQFPLAPGEQLAGSVAQLFQVQGFLSGYVRVDVPVVTRAFFSFYPLINGHARIRAGQSASTIIPVSAYARPDSFFLNSGTVSGRFQGIAVVNPGSSTVTVTLQALNPSGSVVATATYELGAGQISSKLISELFSSPVPEGSVIRITATGSVFATSVTGSASGDLLRSMPALR